MDIKILHSWLLEFLDTKANPATIAKNVSLCGPSIEKVEKYGGDYLYHIEITTNRVDSASVYGMAREASVILPEFNIKARLKNPNLNRISGTDKYSLRIKTNPRLTKRVMAVILENISFNETPHWMKTRLEAAGMRSLNSVVDITNYVMLEIGHPTHVFDYDLIKDGALVFRLADKNEKITSLDDKTYRLNGDEIVIDNGEGEIIDLPGIIGTKNSVVNTKTKRIVFFIDNNDPARIRRASMSLGVRTAAAILNEKGVDPKLGEMALKTGVQLYEKICGAKVASRVYDLHEKWVSPKPITITKKEIEKKIGLSLPETKIINILSKLGFEIKKTGGNFSVKAPSFRSLDVKIPEDIIEEIARIHGYYNLPGFLMSGKIPDQPGDTPFDFEDRIKNTLKGYGGGEIYTLSLVSKAKTAESALQLKNPLGPETEYLRTTLLHSLAEAAAENSGEKEPFHLFEMANVYLAQTNDLPAEKMILAGIFVNTSYREAKGVIESLLEDLNIKGGFLQEDLKNFLPGRRLIIKAGGKEIGEFGRLDKSEALYYEFDMEKTKAVSQSTGTYQPPLKSSPQIEDLTVSFPPKTHIGEVIETIHNSQPTISKVELKDIYKDNYTFRIWYQDQNKTLTDKEVEKIRNKAIQLIKQKFGGMIKN